jgi:glutamate dehydrogenase (NAD(P)+)
VVVQGSGNVGGIGAQLLHEAGYKVVAISDVNGGIYNPAGLDIPAALAHLRATRSFEEYPNAERVSNEDLLELECDVLVPAATENQIRSDNAERLQDVMVASFHDVVKYADTHDVDTRTAAYMLAIDRVAYDTRMRGIYA